MSDRKFTTEQRYAIEARGGTVLVSAAAGSGKTTVLIERILHLITDRERPVDIDRLLVCTFTRDATAEMKRRLSAKLAKAIDASPEDTRLRRQKLLLQNCRITTIHSFCLSLLREYFSQAGVAPDFRTADDSELALLKAEVLSELMDGCYGNMDDDLRTLMDMLSDSHWNTSLDREIQRVDGFLSAYPDPDGKLDELESAYMSGDPPERTEAGKFILSYCGSVLRYYIRLLGKLSEAVEADPELSRCCVTFGKDIALLEDLISYADSGKWDRLYSGLAGVKFDRFVTIQRKNISDGAAARLERLKNDRKYAADQVKGLAGMIPADSAGYADQTGRTLPLVTKLFALVRQYRSALEEKKAQRKIASYDDLIHLAAKLLVKRGENGYMRTPLAKELSRQFDEILIDEYQDTDYTQDLIFRAIAREDGDAIGDGNNMFIVGDVKQSIYGFRNAVPALFLDRLKRYAQYDPQAPVFPAKIILGRNFRSRVEVTDTVNYVFSQLMTAGRGGIDYSDGQQLIFSGGFPESGGMSAELHLLTQPANGGEAAAFGADSQNEDIDSRDEFEAAYCARLIKRMIRDGFCVTDTDSGDNKIMRPARYGDFCIMRRSISGEYGTAYYEKLREAGIPVKVGTESGFFDNPEISVMLSLLRAVNNPLLDIPLTAALRSPIFGFDTDKLALIRAGRTRLSMYACLSMSARGGDEQCREALERLSRLRDMAQTLPTDRVILHILRSTGFLSAVQATYDGAARKDNLLRLMRAAREFESFGFKGLPRFIRTVDKMIENGDELSSSGRSYSDDCVTVRTMHNAKGLEFPICILTGLGSRQNDRSTKGSVSISRSTGIGIKGYDAGKRLRFDTIQRKAASGSVYSAETDEELRVLYVAMTRASDKLIMIASSKTDVNERLAAAAKPVFRDGIDAAAIGLSPAPEKWLTACALRLPDQRDLRLRAGTDDSICGEPAALNVVIPENPGDMDEADDGAENLTDAAVTLEQIKALTPDPILLEKINKRLSYRYPYDQLRHVPVKVTASGAVERVTGRFSSIRPAFMDEDGLTAAQKGTALHRFLELCRFDALPGGIGSEIDRLVGEGGLSQREADSIDISAVERFADSVLPMINGADKVLREWQFSVTLRENLLKYFTEYSAMGECVVLEGECDLLLLRGKKAVIIDYKTDRGMTAEKLVEHYLPQLTLYASAVKQSFEPDGIECYLYSFRLGGLIRAELVETI